jgi:hypothetical protein
MTPERFHQIVEAYGADPRRWPEAERAAGGAWARANRGQADAWLAQASDIDALLAASKVDPPSVALQQRVLAGAPGRASLAPQADTAPRRRWWWSGAAVAGVGVLGGLTGAFAVSFFVLTASAPPAHDSSYLTSSFGGTTADWSDE